MRWFIGKKKSTKLLVNLIKKGNATVTQNNKTNRKITIENMKFNQIIRPLCTTPCKYKNLYKINTFWEIELSNYQRKLLNLFIVCASSLNRLIP